MKPYISVILDAHHHGPYLRQALDSIVDQSFTDYELILIDRAPSGEDQQELRAYAWEHLSALQILCLPPGTGQAVALNQGFAAASGQIVSMLSSNDYWYPNKLDAVARDFGDAQKVGLHQHHLHISKGDRLWGSTCREVLEVGDLCELAVRTGKFPTMFSPLSGLSFSRQILQLVGPIPGQLKEHADEYLTRTVMCYGRLTATDAVHGAHRPGAKSSSPTSSGHHQLLPALHGFYSERGIDIKYTQFDGSNSATSHEDWVRLLGLTPGDVVLAVRTAQPEVMGPLLTELQRVGAQVHLIVQNNVAAHYADQCHQMYLIDNDRIGPASFSAELKTALAETKPRLGVIPYEGLDGRTYGNVHAALNGLRLGCPLMGVAARGGAVYPVPPQIQPVAPSKTEKVNIDRLLALRDRYQGRRAFLIGNGPSLRIEDLDRLREEITIGSNKIFLAFAMTNWRPTVYCISDDVVARNNRAMICSLPQPKVITASAMKYLWEAPKASWINTGPRPRSGGWDLIAGTAPGHSVINMSIKVAYWMGIREIYIIGADHHYVVPDAKTGERLMNNDVLRSNGERNHFHPDYNPPGEELTVPLLDLMEADFQETKEIFEAAGGRIWNASRFSKLNVFERIDFDDIPGL